MPLAVSYIYYLEIVLRIVVQHARIARIMQLKDLLYSCPLIDE